MTQALQKRGLERQKLRADLWKAILKEEEERGDLTFHFTLASTMLAYLQQRRKNSPGYSMATMESFFAEKIRPPIAEFTKSQAEEDSLVAELLKMVVIAATRHFH